MASASRAHVTTTASRIANAAQSLSSDNQSLIAEIRKSLILIKGIAVDLEKDQQFDEVKKLEGTVLELLETYDDCAYFSEAIETIGRNYRYSDQPTDFSKLLEDEVSKLKAASPPAPPQRNPLYRQFKEAVWNVHHAGQPMPGEEQEDIVMTSTQVSLLNVKCPLTGKPVTELQNPVRCMDCKHIYDKGALMHYIRKKPSPKCPVAGCPKVLMATRVVCDPLLLVEIDEMRSGKDPTEDTMVEDFTLVDEED